MSEKSNLEKLRLLLPHWIEHSHSHQDEFKKWADIAEEEGQGETSTLITQALMKMAETDKILEKALAKIGGKMAGEHHHHHHH